MILRLYEPYTNFSSRKDEVETEIAMRPKFLIKILTGKQKHQAQKARTSSILRSKCKELHIRHTIAMSKISCIQISKDSTYKSFRANEHPPKQPNKQRAKTNSNSRQYKRLQANKTIFVDPPSVKMKERKAHRVDPKAFQTLKTNITEDLLTLYNVRTSEVPTSKYKSRRWYDIRPRLILKNTGMNKRKDFKCVKLVLALK